MLNKIVTGVLDTFLPQRCLVCESLTSTEYLPVPLCNVHTDAFEPLTPPLCHYCARPLGNNLIDHSRFEYASEPICGSCRGNELVLNQLFAGYRFDSLLLDMVADWKYKKHPEWGQWFGRKLWEVVSERLDPSDWHCLIPVPLHERRHKNRGFNQALQLAHGFGKAAGLETNNYLRKKRRTDRQSNLSREDRIENLRGAFDVNPRFAEDVSALESVLLIDDIYTTGSTLRTAGSVLKDAGVNRVAGIVLARTLPDQ
jgi:ComF family protein